MKYRRRPVWPMLLMVALLCGGCMVAVYDAMASTVGVAQTFGARSPAASASLAASPAVASTQGDLLVALIKTRNSAAPAPVSSVVDSNAGETWLKAASVASGPNDEEIWYAANAASLGTGQSVTVTAGGTSPGTSVIAFTVLDVTGAALASPLDVTATGIANSTAPSTATSPTTNQASEIVIAGIGWNGNGITLSNQTAGYTTTPVQQVTVPGSYAAEQAAWQVLSATGGQVYAGSLSSAVAWTAVLATFKVGPPPAPTITGFSPGSGPVGTLVTITGSGYTGTSAVAFNSVAAAYSVTDDTHITATVPSTATSGTISVSAPGGTVTSSAAFNVTATPPAPTISGFSPGSGSSGTMVTITGTGFTGTSSVTFNNTAATYSVTDDSDISAAVPHGATSGTIAVTTLGGTATSSSAFIVTAAPPPPHVMVVVEENRDYGGIIGNAYAPYINSLASTYSSATSWYAVEHNSPTDYVDLISGSDQGLPNGVPYSATTLMDELHANGISWQAYIESMPSSCYTKGATADGLYDPAHNPFHYFTNYTTNAGGWCSSANAATEGILPYPGSSGLLTALAGSNAPSYVFVVPNDCNNMHSDTDTGSPCANLTNRQLIQTGDTWLMNNIGPVFNSPWFAQNGIVIITWDEGNGNLGCCGLTAPGGHIPTIVITPYNKGRGSFASVGDHFGTLAAIEKLYGVSLLAGSQNSANGDLTGAFNAVKGAITGTIVDSNTSAAIAGATVSDGVDPSATTDANGNYVLTNVTPGIYTLTASATGYSPQSVPITVAAGSTTSQNFGLGP